MSHSQVLTALRGLVRSGALDAGQSRAEAVAGPAATVTIRVDGHPTPQWSVSTGPDRSVHVGEARATWLNAIAWPVGARYPLADGRRLPDLGTDRILADPRPVRAPPTTNRLLGRSGGRRATRRTVDTQSGRGHPFRSVPSNGLTSPDGTDTVGQILPTEGLRYGRPDARPMEASDQGGTPIWSRRSSPGAVWRS